MQPAVDSLIQLLARETNKVKGDAIEDLAKYIFTTYPNLCDTKEYHKYADLPDNYKQTRRLPNVDKGIDGVMIRNDGSEYAIQAKYRSNQDYKLILDDLCTFMTWVGNTKINGERCYLKGVIICTCRVTDDIPNCFPGDYLLFDYDALVRLNDIVNEFLQLYIQGRFNNIIAPIRPLPKQKRRIQEDIVHAAINYYRRKNSGKIIAACGVGKTLISYWIHQQLGSKVVVILIPSLELLSQMYLNWMRENVAYGIHSKYLLVGSDAAKEYGEFTLSTSPEIITGWLDKNIGENMLYNCYIFSTYASSNIITDALVDMGVEVDLMVYDEAHRVVGSETKYNYSLRNDDLQMLIKRKLFLTATEKILKVDVDNIISMDQDIFGDYIYKYSLRQAIDDGMLCDYKILTIVANNVIDTIVNTPAFKYVVDDDYKADCVIAAMSVVVAIRDHGANHILLYNNTDRSARNMERCMEFVLNYLKIPDIYITTITSADNKKTRELKKRNFIKADIGIISSVRIFNEGVDLSKCDAEVFVDPRSSEVDIIQCIGRGLRLEPGNPNKICKIIIPILTSASVVDILDDRIYGKYEKLFIILRELQKYDNRVIEALQLININNIVGSSDRKYNFETLYTNLDKAFIAYIQLGIFNPNGTRDDKIRSLLVNYNKDHDELILTRKDCMDYLVSLGIKSDEIPNVKNWPKFALDIKQYLIIVNGFYKIPTEIADAIHRLNIKSFEEYKIRYKEDKKLPSVELIDSGLYDNINSGINICSYFWSTDNPIDF